MCTDEHTCTKHTHEFMHYNHLSTEFPFCAFHCPSVEKHLYSRTSDLEAGPWIEMWKLGATNFALSNFVGEEIKKRWPFYWKFWLNRIKVLHLMRNEGEIMEGMADLTPDGEENEEVRVVREGRTWALKITKTQNASSARRELENCQIETRSPDDACGAGVNSCSFLVTLYYFPVSSPMVQLFLYLHRKGICDFFWKPECVGARFTLLAAGSGSDYTQTWKEAHPCVALVEKHLSPPGGVGSLTLQGPAAF